MSSMEGASTGDTAPESAGPGNADLAAILVAETMAVGNDLTQLALVELRLAVGSLGRLFALAIVFLVLGALVWVGASVLVSWLSWRVFESEVAMIVTFIAIQGLGLCMASVSWRRCVDTLTMPRTREHFTALKAGKFHGAH